MDCREVSPRRPRTRAHSHTCCTPLQVEAAFIELTHIQTHNVAVASPIADFVVALRDGRVISQGSLSNALEKDKKLLQAVAKQNERLEKAEQELTEIKPDSTAPGSAGKLVVAEEISEGHVGWTASESFDVLARFVLMAKLHQ